MVVNVVCVFCNLCNEVSGHGGGVLYCSFVDVLALRMRIVSDIQIWTNTMVLRI